MCENDSPRPSNWEQMHNENARLRAENERLQRQLEASQRRLQQILIGSPLLVRELDVSALSDHFATLREQGITDFSAYFAAHPEQVPVCVNLARVAYANRNLLDLYGAHDGVELQKALAREMTPERWTIARDLMVAFAEHRPLPSFETYVRTLQNEERYLITQVSYLNDADPPPAHVLFLSVDATEYKRAELARRAGEEHVEREVRAREAMYRNVIAAADGVVYQMDVHTGTYLFLSPEIEQLTGYRADEFTLKSWLDMEGKSFMRGGLEGLHIGDAIALYSEGKLPRWKADTNYRHRNGEWRWVSDSSIPLFHPDGVFQGSVGILLDITERKHLEEQLLQAQKMESLGRLAGGIAHDFNNLLAVILGYAELAETDLPKDHPVNAYLNKMQLAAERGREITNRLLVFAHKQVYTPQPLDPGALVEGTEDLIRSLLGPEITLELCKDPDPWTVLAHPGQIEQALFNLVINARDAMPTGGTLTLSLQNVEYAPGAQPARGSQSELNPNEFVCIRIQDTGFGMTPEIRRRIFEPFFTTKPLGQGTGLGLSIVYSIVTQNGGHIQVESEPGQGTAFRLYLPRIFGPVTEQAGWQVTGRTSGTETILLVEDETALRDMATLWLQRRGYTVLKAANGVEALAVARSEER